MAETFEIQKKNLKTDVLTKVAHRILLVQISECNLSTLSGAQLCVQLYFCTVLLTVRIEHRSSFGKPITDWCAATGNNWSRRMPSQDSGSVRVTEQRLVCSANPHNYMHLKFDLITCGTHRTGISRLCGEHFANSKVTNLDQRLAAVQHDVLRFQVAVQDLPRVDVLERQRYLHEQSHDFLEYTERTKQTKRMMNLRRWKKQYAQHTAKNMHW